MELGNHEEANEELELIDAPLRVHPDVLEVRWLIYQKVENWELCENIGSALVKLAPERTTGWIHRFLRLARDETHTGGAPRKYTLPLEIGPLDPRKKRDSQEGMEDKTQDD